MRLHRIRDVSGVTLLPSVCGAVDPGAEVRTDGWRGYNGPSENGYRHDPIILSHTGNPAHASMPGVNSVSSLLKC